MLEVPTKDEGVQEKNVTCAARPPSLSANSSIAPGLLAAVEAISPEDRVKLEKRIKLKLDCIMFPTLLVFYILNYLVSTPKLVIYDHYRWTGKPWLDQCLKRRKRTGF